MMLKDISFTILVHIPAGANMLAVYEPLPWGPRRIIAEGTREECEKAIEEHMQANNGFLPESSSWGVE